MNNNSSGLFPSSVPGDDEAGTATSTMATSTTEPVAETAPAGAASEATEGQTPPEAPAPATGPAIIDVADAGPPQAPQPAASQLASTPPAPYFPPPPIQASQLQTPSVLGSGGGGGGQQQQQQQQPPLDSLSLAQLRRLTAEMPRNEPVLYDYAYEDIGTFDEEMDEWFSYQVWQWVRLNHAHQSFDGWWERLASRDIVWDDADPATRKRFVARLLRTLDADAAAEAGTEAEEPRERPTRLEVAATLAYLLLGRWGATAGGPMPDVGRSLEARTVARELQLDAMREAAALVDQVGGIPILWKALRQAFEPFWGTEELAATQFQDAQDELAHMMTIFYVLMQATLSEPVAMAACYNKLGQLQPPIPEFMMSAASRLRWDDNPAIPQGQVFLLLWKALLLVFGGTRELAETKRETAESTADGDKEQNLITASPLDYNAFRHEITSKYPSYVPPQPLLPLEDDNTTLLPPPPNHPPRNNGANGILPGPPNNVHGGASILNQPVHIATPAPSPPPSPAGGGKGGKKQNYQTNQNFPFLYPPLDATSNGAGGKGPAAMQDALVGRKWEGSDVPSSILEAGELFSKRVRMTRATRQLWDEREKFLQFERGWADDGDGADDLIDDDLIDDLDLSSLTLAEREELGLVRPATQGGGDGKEREAEEARKARRATGEGGSKDGVDLGPRPDEVSECVRKRLDALEAFYGETLPQLQSLVIVLLKAILMNVAVLMSQGPAGGGPQQPQQMQSQQQQQQQHPAAARLNRGGIGGGSSPPVELSVEEIDAVRTREISAKAVSGILLLLLKWLKVSHVLKFEYLTQLLLDCNYVPLLLKLWTHQDVQQLIDNTNNRIENSFFYFCNIRAGVPEEEAEEDDEEEDVIEEDDSEDEAMPPAIKRHRSPAPPMSLPMDTGSDESGADIVQASRGEGGAGGGGGGDGDGDGDEEDGADAAQQLITTFNRRNFFSLINLLRVMQKICKNKAHRNLLMVQYKSSNILRKMLRTPQPMLRLYTLKLFKNQVPYCGRKWRQGNMRVITAVYLHCRPELRDEWLAGSDVDAEVEGALPLEQALRSLTHWFNVRRYPDKMAPEVRMALREEHDFFVRELEKQDLNWAELNDGESMMSEW